MWLTCTVFYNPASIYAEINSIISLFTSGCFVCAESKRKGFFDEDFHCYK